MDANQVEQTLKDFEKADLNLIRDAKWRRRAEELRAKQSGFTLLELLVVVAILAIIAGAVLASLDGKEEGAAQATAVHTMAALENSMRIYKVTEKRVLPGELDSLICTSGISLSSGAYAADISSVDNGSATNILLSNNTATSNVARIHGGLTGDLYGKLALVGVTSGAMESLTDNGLTSLRYVNGTICNGTGGENLFTTAAGFDANITEPALVDVSKPALIFADPVVEDDDWEFGAGASVDLTQAITTQAIPMAFYAEPAELGEEEEAVLAVFGVGPSADLGSVIARAPQDGNVGPDKYANYSIVVKVAECPDDSSIEDFESTCAVNLWREVGEDVRVVAVLDAGGDGYDDEIAEAKGNEEE